MTKDELAAELLRRYRADGRHAQIEHLDVPVLADLFKSVEQRDASGQWRQIGGVTIATARDSYMWVTPGGFAFTGDIGRTLESGWSDAEFLMTTQYVLAELERVLGRQTLAALSRLGHTEPDVPF